MRALSHGDRERWLAMNLASHLDEEFPVVGAGFGDASGAEVTLLLAGIRPMSDETVGEGIPPVRAADEGKKDYPARVSGLPMGRFMAHDPTESGF